MPALRSKADSTAALLKCPLLTQVDARSNDPILARDAYARASDAKSVQTSFLHYLFGGYLTQFNVVVRKLILELQTRS